MEITVSNVDLNSAVGVIREYDDEGSLVSESGGVLLGDIVAEKIVENLQREAQYANLRKQVATVREDLIRETLVPKIEEVAAAPIRKTNGYGEYAGEPVTLRELILELATKELANPAKGYNTKHGESMISFMVRECVTKVVGEQLAAQQSAIQAQVTALVNQNIVALAKKALNNA